MNKFIVPTYDVVKFEKEMGNGITNPLLMKTRHDSYVVKFVGNTHGEKILINEFVCYKLCKLLEVPIPDAALIKIDENVIDTDKRLQDLNVQPGVHFGSRLVPKSQSSLQLPLMNLVNNTEDIPSIILFDQIIYNNDRTLNKGNLLFDIKTRRILVIDHSHTFKIGALWDQIQLKKIHEEDLCLVDDFHGHNYRLLLKYVNGNNPFNNILQKVQKLSQHDIDYCFEQIPEQWLLTVEEKAALKDFIWYRIENIEHFLSLLREQCPNWKGGDWIEG